MHRWRVTTREEPATHVLLSGGRLHVGEDERDAFFEAYADEVVAGRPLHVVESTARGFFNMFADIDLKAATDSGGNALASAVLDIALGAMPPEMAAREVIVCSRRWSPKDGKIGLHLTFPGLRVDDASAKALRDAWVDRIASGPCAGNGRPWWDSAIDAAVYRNSGLRMPWSRKVGGCPMSVYIPTHVLDAGGGVAGAVSVSVDAGDRGSVLRWLRRASLMRSAGCDGQPSQKYSYTPQPKQLQLQHNAILADVKGVPAEYLESVIQVRRMGSAVVASLSSRTCCIAGRAHSSNHVYLIMSPDGRVVQRCHSAKCAGQEHVLRRGTGDRTRPSGCVASPAESGRGASMRAAQFWTARIASAKQMK